MSKFFPRFLTLLFICGWSLHLQGQSFDSWIVGDTADLVTTNYLPGLVLAGGGTDNDQAMQWMLERAGGGDVLVIRASGSNGYNSYFYSELGVSVNSVETIRFNSIDAASDPYVLRRLAEAEVLFIAGGDQYDYYQLWKDNEVEDAINKLHAEKGITIGGTSAGMAILGHYYYTPNDLGIISEEALADPFHPYMDILGANDFLDMPYMEQLITDTHFDQRDRAGRLMAFMARLTEEQGKRTFGIAANEYTAVVIDPSGMARAYGEYPTYEEDQVYFLQANCLMPFEPETITPGVPLSWNQNEAAVKVYRVPATLSAEHYFQLSDWQTGDGGFWEDWYVENGELFQLEEALPNECALTGVDDFSSGADIRLLQNPIDGDLRLVAAPALVMEAVKTEVWDPAGRLLLQGEGLELDCRALPAGYYFLHVHSALGRQMLPFYKL